MMYSILIYGFPLTLLAFEWGLRTIIGVDSSGFTGPTLAAAGLTFLMPLTKPKERTVSGHENLVAMSKLDASLMPVIWIFVFAFLFSWAWSCYMSIKYPNSSTLGFSTHLVIGGAVYVISLILTGIKEKA